MKKAVVIAFVVLFAACMIHYFYAEDHCPVHCPSKGGGFGHLHHPHSGASVCLCFWSSLFGPEPADFVAVSDFLIMRATADDVGLRSPLGADIAHPPKSSLA